ncbi:hypothetical protein PUN28_019954 [Cardiocondyla obscurior]|uniref:Uncharacterized protein n=1 Tax=Cardiocondyla obscurior TaxID=286306 RepID=A0AAW2E889_9HYME
MIAPSSPARIVNQPNDREKTPRDRKRQCGLSKTTASRTLEFHGQGFYFRGICRKAGRYGRIGNLSRAYRDAGENNEQNLIRPIKENATFRFLCSIVIFTAIYFILFILCHGALKIPEASPFVRHILSCASRDIQRPA